MEPIKTSPLTLHGTAGATAILLRQYFFALRVLEEGPYVINSLESVQNLLSGMESARECPLIRVLLVPGRLDGMFFCRALGKQGNSMVEGTPKRSRRANCVARASAPTLLRSRAR
jgi:hypothetical protein